MMMMMETQMGALKIRGFVQIQYQQEFYLSCSAINHHQITYNIYQSRKESLSCIIKTYLQGKSTNTNVIFFHHSVQRSS